VWVYNVRKIIHRPRISDASFLADTVDTTSRLSSCIHLRFCGVLCIARSARKYTNYDVIFNCRL